MTVGGRIESCVVAPMSPPHAPSHDGQRERSVSCGHWPHSKGGL